MRQLPRLRRGAVMAKNIKIQETIHHGDYRHKRVIEVHALTMDTVAGVLMSSPYAYTKLSRDQVDDVMANLQEQGAAQLGWSNFEIVEAD